MAFAVALAVVSAALVVSVPLDRWRMSGSVEALAEDGYVVVAPGLMRGSRTRWLPSTIWQTLRTPDERVRDDLDAVLAAFTDRSDVDPTRVEVNALIGGHFGVPVTLVTGDGKAVAQVQDLRGEQVVSVIVKHGYTTFSAIHLHPKAAQARIREGAQQAYARAAGAKPLVFEADTRVEIDLDHQARAQACLYVPGIELAGERTVAFTASDALAFNDLFHAVMSASGITFSP